MSNKYSFINELFMTLFIFVISINYFYSLDRGFLLENNFFPWDSYAYEEMAQIFFNNSSIQKLSDIAHPFNQRIIFPYLIALTSKLSGLNFAYSAMTINLFCTFAISIIFLRTAKIYNISNFSKFFAIIVFFSSHIMPLRYSIYYPGGNFAFDTLLVSLVIWFFLANKDNKISLFKKILIIMVFFIGTMQRGILFILISTTPILLIYLQNYLKLKKKIHHFFEIYKNSKIYFINFYTSILSFVLLKIIVPKGPGDYSMIREVVSSTHFQANIFEFLYKYYYALGIFFFLIVAYIIQKKQNLINFKKKFFLLSYQQIFIISIFLNSIFLSTVGGRGDVDRFLLWFLLIYILYACLALDFLIKEFKIKIILPILLISIIWARPYVPSWPTPSFSNLFTQKSFVNTNFSDNFFYGPQIIKKFRNDMIEITINKNTKWKPVYFRNHNMITQVTVIPSNQYTADGSYNRWANAFKYKINDIPFPLGYIHNQRNFLVDHPYHGNNLIRFILILQWITLQIFMFFYLKKN